MSTFHLFLVKFLTNIIRPFYGTGIGKYFPFRQFNSFYKGLSRKQDFFVKTKYDFDIFVQDNTFIEGHILMYGCWEENISKLIATLLNEGDTFLDVGANIGYDSLLASKHVGVNGEVLAFEPSQRNYSKLLRNIELNKFTNIKTFPMGLGNSEDTFEVFFSVENPGATSIIQTNGNKDFEKEQIKVATFDGLFPDKKIDFIKMDIEGFEFEAMLGMQSLFKRSNNLKMIFEFSPGFYQYKSGSAKEYSINILNSLQEWGFDIFHIEDDANLTLIGNFEDYYARFDLVHIKQADLFCRKGS